MSNNKDTQLIWESYFQEKNKKPDGDGDGVPDWADKHHGEDDHEEEKVEEANHDKDGDGDEDAEDYKLAKDEAIKNAKQKQVNEELDGNDQGKDYMNWLLSQRDKMVEAGADPDEAGENLLSHAFEETYVEYLRSKGASEPYPSAEAHLNAAKYLNVYHEVDLNELQNFRHR